jgi:hypothetical protein
MATTGFGVPPVRKKKDREKAFTVMVMGRMGKVRSFRISRRLFFWAALFFVAYIPFSVYLVNRYFELYFTDVGQKHKIEFLEKDLLRSNHALSRARDHIAFLEDYTLQLEKQGDQASESSKPQEKRAGTSSQKDSEAKAPDKEGGKISIEDMVMERQGTELNLSFKIVNINPGNAGVGGYVHMIGKGEQTPPRRDWTFPQEKLVNGLPENFRRGQVFLIQRFKPMQGKLNVGSGSDAPTILEILVYDQSGEIMLQKEFQIGHAP